MAMLNNQMVNNVKSLFLLLKSKILLIQMRITRFDHHVR